MDITRGPVEQQVSPPPVLARLQAIDLSEIFESAIRLHPDVSVDDIATKLRAQGLPAPAVLIARLKQMRLQRELDRLHQVPSAA